MKMQVAFFEKIKDVIPNKKDLPKILMELLDVNLDSVYRRMRGETGLTLDEAFLISHHFKMSLSDLESFRNDHVTFVKRPLITSISAYKNFMLESIEHLEMVLDDPKHEMLIMAKDLPTFYAYQFKELGAFKLYIWLRSIGYFESIVDDQFDMNIISKELLDLSVKEWKLFEQINVTEIWNESTVFSLLNQIEYYFDSGLFKSKDDALMLCDQFIGVLKNIYRQAARGWRGKRGDDGRSSKIDYSFFFNQSVVLDNYYVFKVNSRIITSVPYVSVNFITSNNEVLGAEMNAYINQVSEKSSAVSNMAEKERNKLFLGFQTRVNQLKSKIENTNPFML